MGDYFIHHFIERKRASASQPAFRYRSGEEWISYTWGEIYQRCNSVVNYLSKSCKEGSLLGILGKNSINWIIVDYASLLSDKISMPFHIWMERENLLSHLSLASLLFIDSDFLPFVKGEYPDEKIITLDRKVGDYLFVGEIFERECREDLIEACQTDIREDDITTIIFTSGNAGRSAGSLISQGALGFEINSIRQLLLYNAATDEQMIFMPFSQTLGRLAEILPVGYGFPTVVVNLVDSRMLSGDMKEVQPTVMVAYPDYFDYLKDAFEQIFETAPLYKKIGFEAMLHLKLENNKLARKFKDLIKNTIKAHLGKNIRFFICGGGGLKREITDFFENLKIPILTGYGMAETCGATHLNTIEKRRSGSAGLPLAGVEAKIGEGSHIYIRGPNLMKGYLNNTRKAEITPDGWLRVDDTGRIDPDGFLFIDKNHTEND